MKLCCWALMVALLFGCSAGSRVVRLDIDQVTPVVFTPRSNASPVELGDTALREVAATLSRGTHSPASPQRAARQLFEVDARSGSFTYEARSGRLTPVGVGEQVDEDLNVADVKLTRAYLSWCESTGRPGDCLRLLTESTTVNGDGRFMLAMALAKGFVLDEMLEAFKDMADPHAMVSAVLWTWTTYMILLTVPEPLTKGIAAVMTATLICYVGVDTFWGLIMGFKQLMAEAEEATTFNGLRAAGERYGKVMGRNAARAFAMLATAAIGSTTPVLAARVPKLPGAMQAAVQAETQVGIRLAEVGAVTSVAVNAEAVTIVLAPGAVAMTSDAPRPRRFSKADRDAAYEKNQDANGQAHCDYCDKELTQESGQSNSYEADHRKPYSKGGASSSENLAPSCRACNREKGAKEPDTEWIPPNKR